jgi:hypothetical protein
LSALNAGLSGVLMASPEWRDCLRLRDGLVDHLSQGERHSAVSILPALRDALPETHAAHSLEVGCAPLPLCCDPV